MDRYPDFDYPIDYGDAPTAADFAEDACADQYQKALASATDQDLLDDLGSASIPLVSMIRRGVSDEKLGRIVRMCLHRLVEIEAAHAAGDEDELDRLTREDTEMRELLAELGFGPVRAAPTMAVAEGVAA